MLSAMTASLTHARTPLPQYPFAAPAATATLATGTYLAATTAELADIPAPAGTRFIATSDLRREGLPSVMLKVAAHAGLLDKPAPRQKHLEVLRSGHLSPSPQAGSDGGSGVHC